MGSSRHGVKPVSLLRGLPLHRINYENDCIIRPGDADLSRPCAVGGGKRAGQPSRRYPAGGGDWKPLFNGKNLDGWTASDFAGHADPDVEDGAIVIPMGVTLTGVTYGGDVPKMDYEVEVQAKRAQGSDFFCGITFPVDDTFASLIIGGWGGGTCGISSLDEKDAAHNSTTTYHKFNKDQWYTIRLRVTAHKLEAWVDKEKIVDVDTTGKKIALRQDIDAGKPFSIATYQTTAALKDIRIRSVKERRT